MAYLEETRRKIPIIEQSDVVVIGGGPGGLSAAVCAARHGADVTLIERYGFMGGLATAGLVAPILGVTAEGSNRPIVEGLLKEIAERLHRLDGAPKWEDICKDGFHFNPEALKFVADNIVRESGVRLLLHSYAVDSVCEDEEITALIIENKSGRAAIKGDVFIDATGDADIAFSAGAETVQGREFDGAVQSMGSFIHIGGISEITEDQKKNAVEMVKEAMEEEKLHFYNPKVTNMCDLPRDHFSPNISRCNGDPTDVRDLTSAEIKIRSDAWKLTHFLKENAPGFEDIYLRQTSPQVGPRESRQVIGEYVLTAGDIRKGRKFDDGIARGSWWVDIHCPLGYTYPVHLCVKECPRAEKCPFWRSEHDTTMLSREELRTPTDDWYDIPYRTLLAKGTRNLLSSGRCISATHQAMAGARVMGTCLAIGQAAGTAAAMAADRNIIPSELDSTELVQTLESDGALV